MLVANGVKFMCRNYNWILLLLLLFSSRGIAASEISAVIIKSPAGSWSVSYTSDAPVTRISFQRSPDSSRGKRWRIKSADFKVVKVNDYETVRRVDGKPFTQVEFELTPTYISLPKDYAPFSPFTDGGMLFHSGFILGLPGETYETHIRTIRDILRANIDLIYIYTLMLLDGSELNTPKERQTWNFNTKFRILPRDFVKLKNGKVVLEIEEVAIGSNTLSFDEYVELRLLALLILITQRTPSYQALFKFLKLYDLETFDLVYAMLKNTDLSSQNIQKFFNQFKQATIDELWDTEEELKKHYQDPNEYNKLLNSTVGQNLLFFFHALAISEHIRDYTNFVLKTAKDLITKKTNKNIDKEFLTISNYCIGSCHNIFGDDRMETNPEFDYDYDILAWMNSHVVSFLSSFELDKKLKIIFELTEEQYKTVEDSLDIFGHNKIGRSQVIKVVGQNKLWRKPIVIKQV